jgi:hypothetical protein
VRGWPAFAAFARMGLLDRSSRKRRRSVDLVIKAVDAFLPGLRLQIQHRAVRAYFLELRPKGRVPGSDRMDGTLKSSFYFVPGLEQTRPKWSGNQWRVAMNEIVEHLVDRGQNPDQGVLVGVVVAPAERRWRYFPPFAQQLSS